MPVSPLVGGTGLAAHPVARHLAVAAGAAADHVLQHLPDRGGGLLADDLPDGGGVVLLDHVAVAVQLLIHHVGLVEVSAVDAGGLGGDELEGGDVVVLAKGVAGQIQGGERLPGGEDAPHVPLEVHACLVHQAEVLHVVVEPVGPHGQADADKGRVAGVPHRLLEHLMPVAAVVGTADGVVADGHGAAAVKGAAGVHRPLLQGHGQGEDLGRGAGLVGVVHRLVAPLLQLQLPQLLPVGVGVLLVRGGGILLVHLGQLLL